MIQCLNCSVCPRLNNLPNTGAWQNWDDDYNAVVNNLQEIELLIVGQNPYKIRATGIAFCKPTWFELLDNKYSALSVFCGLGIKLGNAAYDEEHYPTPNKFFIDLAQDYRLVFVNACDAQKHRNKISKKWLNKAKYSILCGSEAQKLSLADTTHFYVVHPSSYNENVNHVEWENAWGHHESLLDAIKCNNSDAEKEIRRLVSLINTNISNGLSSH
jgi:hypothetical protein